MIAEALLDDVLGLVATRRRRTPVEAPPHLTGGYALLILAVGYARVGLEARARGVWDQALTSFGDVRRDPVHAWLLDAYGARIAHAIARASPRAPLPAELSERYAALDRMARYKVGRLRESSPSLDANVGDDFAAIGIATGQRAPSAPTAGEPSATEIAARLALEPSRAAIEAMLRLDEASAIDLLARLAPTALSQPAIGAALTVAARFGFAELVPPLLARAERDGESLDAVLRIFERGAEPTVLESERAHLAIVRALVRLGLGDQLPGFSTTVARAALGDPILRAEAPDAIARVAALMPNAARSSFRALASVFSVSPAAMIRDDLRRLFPIWAHTTDSFGTNSHFTLSPLSFVDLLVCAIVDHHLMSLTPRSADPAVAWPYLL